MAEPKEDKHLSAFLEELTALQKKYQYNLVATLNVTNKGILPTIGVERPVPQPTPKQVDKKIIKSTN